MSPYRWLINCKRNDSNQTVEKPDNARTFQYECEYLTEAREMPRSSRPEMNTASVIVHPNRRGRGPETCHKETTYASPKGQSTKTWPGFCKNIDVMKDMKNRNRSRLKGLKRSNAPKTHGTDSEKETCYRGSWASQVAQQQKNPVVSAGDTI